MGREAALLYAEIVSKYLYFYEKGQLTDDGYFYNTIENIERDTTLTAHEQRKAIKILELLLLINVQKRGIPPKRHFKVNFDINHLKKVLGMSEKSQMLKFLMFKSENFERLKVDVFNANNTKNNFVFNNNKGLGSFPPKKENPTVLSFKTFKSSLKEKNTEAVEAMGYFVKAYEMIRGENHPKLKKETWEEILDTILYVEGEHGGTLDLSLDDIEAMTKHYFTKGEYYQENCNFSIAHFNCPGVKKVNYYESGCH